MVTATRARQHIDPLAIGVREGESIVDGASGNTVFVASSRAEVVQGLAVLPVALVPFVVREQVADALSTHEGDAAASRRSRRKRRPHERDEQYRAPTRVSDHLRVRRSADPGAVLCSAFNGSSICCFL
jgi:hypothetical protein